MEVDVDVQVQVQVQGSSFTSMVACTFLALMPEVRENDSRGDLGPLVNLYGS